jgi:hypothetical protein
MQKGVNGNTIHALLRILREESLRRYWQSRLRLRDDACKG